MMLSRAKRLQQSMVTEPALDGKLAKVFVLSNKHGMQVTLMDIGATWLSCELPVDESLRDVLLGVNTMAEHQAQDAYLGATVGRYANRIKNGQFSIGDDSYQIVTNQGQNTLHGGTVGFDKRRWYVEQHSEQEIVFSLASNDGEQGFPGNLLVRVSYHLSDENALTIHYLALSDKACPVNLTNHAYFNLSGGEAGLDCLTHQMMINADQYVPSDETGIPTGDFKSVAQTGFDFRHSKEIGCDFLTDTDQKLAAGYDHSFIINSRSSAITNSTSSVMNERAVEVISPDKKVKLTVCTTKPAVHLYTGNFLAGLNNRVGGQYQNQAGFALETQFLADAPNHLEWQQPNPILNAGDLYDHKTRFSFEC
jgi:aldose 1-epimerase